MRAYFFLLFYFLSTHCYTQGEIFKINDYPNGMYSSIFDLLNKKPINTDSVFFKPLEDDNMPNPIIYGVKDHVMFYYKKNKKKVKGFSAIKVDGYLYINEGTLLSMESDGAISGSAEHPLSYHRVMLDGKLFYTELKLGLSPGMRAVGTQFGLMGALMVSSSNKKYCGILLDPRAMKSKLISDCEKFVYILGINMFETKVNCDDKKNFDIYRVRNILAKELDK